MSELADLIASGGAGSAFNRDTPTGTRVGGRVLSTAVRQVTDYKTGELLFWQDGNPRQQIVVTVETDLRDPELDNDDGHRSIYIKWWGESRKRLLDAVRAAGDKDVRVGGQFAATYVGRGEAASRDVDAPKLYHYEYTPPSATAGLIEQPAAPAAQTVAQPAATPPPAQPAAQPAPTPAPAAQPSAADGAAKMEQIKQLIAAGLTDEQIVGVVGVDLVVVAAIKNTLAPTG
jgi:hypothetical protein